MSSQYQKVSAKDHVLLRPDTYVGSVEPVIWDNTNIDSGELTVIPAICKIFD